MKHQKPKPSLEGFYHYLTTHGVGKQSQYFKYALGRLAKEFPDTDPRVVVLEWFAEIIYAYEESLDLRKYRREPLSKLLEAVKSRGSSQEGTAPDDLQGEDDEERSLLDSLDDSEAGGVKLGK